jgi:hypothetical protein
MCSITACGKPGIFGHHAGINASIQTETGTHRPDNNVGGARQVNCQVGLRVGLIRLFSEGISKMGFWFKRVL